MPLFRKKPIVIEAVQYDGSNEGYDLVCEFAPGVHFDPCGDQCFTVPTLEGDMRASPNDWIIRGVKGELYPCKPDVFESTYEPASTQVDATPPIEPPHRELRPDELERMRRLQLL